ncbi:gliding motility lipoprotein GldB [Chryseotalea sanaruensis]|uniref:gliding motility lipoprotein GldB n=1 Tax=Chryseotalea sanaruensis TaxID=2482724 RepID=UPI000F8F1BF3|nr:gliding motility lipoprotein GldB [Chryseotalea sanaruensis]
MMRHLFTFLVLCAFVVACTNKSKECVDAPNVSVQVELQTEDLREVIHTITDKQSLVDILGKHQVFRDQFLHRSEYPDDSTFINTLYQRFTNPYFDSLYFETQRVFGDLQALREEFEQAFTNLYYYYPEYPQPKIQFVITGLDGDLYLSDSLIIVGVDHYLGAGAKYRPRMYEYILRQYIPENIVPSVMLLYGIDTKVNATNMNDKTVLADMIAYGKSYYFAKQMLPCKADSILMNYSAGEIAGARKNQDLIWFRLVEDEVLYSTANIMKQRFLGERPKTVEVGPECPGRIAQWVGWQIVNSYMKNHPDVVLQDLMKNQDADKLFKESKYKATKR